MHKYWLIYSKKIFDGFKAAGFNDLNELERFKDEFRENLVFIETLKSSREIKKLSLKEEYEEFVRLLKEEGDTEIPPFEQYKKDIREWTERRCVK